MPTRQVEIDRRIGQLGVSKQHLDGAEIGTRFKQVRRVAVPKRVRRNPLGQLSSSARSCEVESAESVWRHLASLETYDGTVKVSREGWSLADDDDGMVRQDVATGCADPVVREHRVHVEGRSIGHSEDID